MSERSTKPETLSINFSGSMTTDDPNLFIQFMDDWKELFAEWQGKVQITSLNLAVHDRRAYQDAREPSEARRSIPFPVSPGSD